MALELRRVCWAERAGDELFLYGMADGAELVRRCHAALVASLARAPPLPTAPPPAAPPPAAPPPAAPPSEAEQLRHAMHAMQGQLGTWQPGTWHAVWLWGELARGGAAPHARTLALTSPNPNLSPVILALSLSLGLA